MKSILASYLLAHFEHIVDIKHLTSKEVAEHLNEMKQAEQEIAQALVSEFNANNVDIIRAAEEFQEICALKVDSVLGELLSVVEARRAELGIGKNGKAIKGKPVQESPKKVKRETKIKQ